MLSGSPPCSPQMPSFEVVGVRLAAPLAGHRNELPDAVHVYGLEGVPGEDAAFQVPGEEGAFGVVAGEGRRWSG